MHTKKDETTTEGYAIQSIDDLPQLWEGVVKLVRAGLGISAFGVNIIDLPPDYTTESHDESTTGQQELYVALRGSGRVLIGDQPLTLDSDHLVRVDAGVERTLSSDGDGLRVLCVGSTPGAPYTPQTWSSGEDA